jgi:hypothetical protein
MPTTTIGMIRLTIVAKLRIHTLLIVNNLGALQPARNLRQGRPTTLVNASHILVTILTACLTRDFKQAPK